MDTVVTVPAYETKSRCAVVSGTVIVIALILTLPVVNFVFIGLALGYPLAWPQAYCTGIGLTGWVWLLVSTGTSLVMILLTAAMSYTKKRAGLCCFIGYSLLWCGTLVWTILGGVLLWEPSSSCDMYADPFGQLLGANVILGLLGSCSSLCGSCRRRKE